MKDKFEFLKSHKVLSISLLVVGLILVVAGLFVPGGSSVRFWANLLLNNYIFLGFCLGATIFIALMILLTIKAVARPSSSLGNVISYVVSIILSVGLVYVFLTNVWTYNW